MIYAARRAAKILGYFGRQILGARVVKVVKETNFWAPQKKTIPETQECLCNSEFHLLLR